ncbi:MAG: hypothetical protein EA401_03220 [Planctomycetota bacterium]|nr:MAG: hypothetical protein EA401_03220 [Planctomycetota bacterium]
MAIVPGLDITVDHQRNRAIITVYREFDEGLKREEWSQAVIDHLANAKNLDAVEVNLGKCPIISSTVIAGLVHLYDQYGETCPQGVILRHCTSHVQRILEMMKLLPMFSLEDPLERN